MDAQRIPAHISSANQARHVLADYVSSTKSFYGVGFEGIENQKPMVYDDHEKAKTKYRLLVSKNKPFPRVQMTPQQYDHALWYSMHGEEPFV